MTSHVDADCESEREPGRRIARCARAATLALVAALCQLLVLSAPMSARAQAMRVGDHIPADISLPAQLDEVSGVSWSEAIHHPGATYIALHFSDFDLGDDAQLVVSDVDGNQSYSLTRRGKQDSGTFWSQHVKGDTVVLTLVSSGGAAGSFHIDEYVAGFAELGGQTEAICGADDKDNAVCYVASHPTEYQMGKAVARLLINGSSLCTGWLASASNHLVTNEHCITTASDALNTDYEFDSEAPTCGSANCQLCHSGTVFSGATFLKDSASLDYALVRITSGNPAGTFGFLEIDDRNAVVGEEIYIPQHPGGRAKELGIFSDFDGGECVVANITEPACSGFGLPYFDVGYFCDTEGGSSGSPVLARSSNKVIALHHCANCENRGVPIDLVYDEIAPFLGTDPTVQLKINGQHPANDIVTVVGGGVRLSLDMNPGAGGPSMGWYWAIIFDSGVYDTLWVTQNGFSLTPGPLLNAPPVPLNGRLLLNTGLSSGSFMTFVFFLWDGSSVVALDYITAVSP